jgi:sulfotransferase
MFAREALGSVYERRDAMLRGNFLGGSLNALRHAWFSDEAPRVVAVRYDSLARSPGDTIKRLYTALGEQPYAHDFENVAQRAQGLRRCGRQARLRYRQGKSGGSRDTILPPDLFRRNDVRFLGRVRSESARLRSPLTR